MAEAVPAIILALSSETVLLLVSSAFGIVSFVFFFRVHILECRKAPSVSRNTFEINDDDM